MPRFAHIFFLLIFPLLIFSQDSRLKTYTTADGLPESAIYDCVQADNGNMWFASEHVLIEYDGKNWISHDSLDSQNPGHSFRFIKKDEQGTLWAFPKNVAGSIWFLKSNHWKSVALNTTSYRNIVACDVKIIDGKPEVLIIAELSQIFYYKDGQLTEIFDPSLEKLSVHDGKIVDRKILLATGEGLRYYSPETKIIGDNILQESKIVYSIEEDPINNKLYLLTNSTIEILNHNKSNLSYKIPPPLYFEYSTNFVFLSRVQKGDFIYGSKYSCFQFNPSLNLTLNLDQSRGFTTTGATSVYVDYEKNIWITTLRGINKLRYSPFYNLSLSDGLLEDEVTSIEKFPNGPIVFGHNSGFTFWKNNKPMSISLNSIKNIANSRIIDMAYNQKDDVIWFVSERLGIGYLNRDSEINWVVQDNLANQTSYMSILIEEEGKIYYSTFYGLYTIENNKRALLISDKSLNIRKLYKFDDNRLIAATRKGVLLYDKKSKSQLFINEKNNPKTEVYSFFKLNTNTWLVGTLNGLFTFNGERLSNFSRLTIDAPIYFINRENEYIWFGLMGGALRWNPESGEKRLFSTFEGLSGIETNRDAFLFDDGKVYIGTNSGLSIFVPDRFDDEYFKVKPMINFNGFYDLSGNKYELNDDFALSYQENDIELRYISPSFIDEDGIEYFIENSDEDDNSISKFVTNRGNFTLQNLPTSSFYISLFSKNSYGISSDTLRSARITIPPPFYLEFWFLGLVVLIALSATYAIYDYLIKSRYSKQLEMKVEQRTEQLLKSEKNIRDLTQRIFTAQEEEREKIARDLHDNIAQEMALVKLEIDKIAKEGITPTDINYQWLTNKLTELTKYLRDLSYFLHPNTIKQTGFVNAIQSMCNEFSSLSKIHIEFYSNITDSFSINEEVSTNIYRFVQEALTNIRKHSEAESGIVIIVTKDNYLTVRIEDDGAGFELSDETKTSNHRSMGLKSMEERIRFVGGELSIKSGKDEGTKLNAKIPLSRMVQLPYSTKLDHESGS